MESDLTTSRSGIAKRFVVSRKTLISSIFLFIVLSTTFLPPEVVSLIVLLSVAAFFVFSKLKIRKRLVSFILPLLFLIAAGSVWAYSNVPYNVFKDYWYAGKPVLEIVAGYTLASKIDDVRIIFRLIIIAAVITVLFHFSKFVLDPSLFTMPVRELRDEAGRGYIITVIAISTIVACRKHGIRLYDGRVPLAAAAVVLCMLSLLLSFSRTFWISQAIMLLSIYGAFSLRNVKKIALLIVLVATLIGFLLTTPEKVQTGPDATFRGKMAYSMKELMIKEYVHKKDIAQNWRGFESYLALKTYLEGNFAQYVTGRGFGTMVDLGFYIKLGEGRPMRYIDTLHNGYMYILIKTGILGLSLYFYFFIKVFLQGSSIKATSSPELRVSGELVSALSLVFLAVTVVIAGLYNKGSMAAPTMFLGALTAFIHTYKTSPSPRQYTFARKGTS